MAYNYEEKLILHCLCQEKKILSPEVCEKKILTQITHIHRPSQKSNGRPLSRSGHSLRVWQNQ